MAGAFGHVARNKPVTTNIGAMGIAEYIRIPSSTDDNDAAISTSDEGNVVLCNHSFTDQRGKPISWFIFIGGGIRENNEAWVSSYRKYLGQIDKKTFYVSLGGSSDPHIYRLDLLDCGRFSIINKLNIPMQSLTYYDMRYLSLDIFNKEIRTQICSKILATNVNLFDSGISRFTSVMRASASFLDATDARNQNPAGDDSIDDSDDGSPSRPPAYLFVMLCCFCVAGLVIAGVGLEGRGHPIYLAGGWIISVTAGGALVWWWV